MGATAGRRSRGYHVTGHVPRDALRMRVGHGGAHAWTAERAERDGVNDVPWGDAGVGEHSVHRVCVSVCV
eukprot:3337723-Prymnesium_polylepis.1